ncbi:NLR family CARD domain-containing protein 3-like isoform X1 [Astyanax mexicanus]|uniref:NLR family CARD domain-containing protein 3-like isoform X1 n=1 Tax=Astyanax mexicanus TaxID=7994 RepID=UPI0020CB4C15|nr:NLR family CARD domain-containing protein 3-like isoform X1 [Astyanax mexicanus]
MSFSGETHLEKDQRHTSDTPEPSSVSMKSNKSMEPPVYIEEGECSPDVSLFQTKGSHSPETSCVSMKSDESMDSPLKLGDKASSPVDRVQRKNSNLPSNNHLESIFKDLEDKLISQVQTELKIYKMLLSAEYSVCFETEAKDDADQSSPIEGVLKSTLNILRNMGHTDLANTLQIKMASKYQQKLKSKLTEKFKRINEGISQHGTSTLLNEIYTDLYITEGGSGKVNSEHEVRQIETASRRPATQEKPISCNDLFKDKPENQRIRTVLTNGVAGIGKTVSVQKFILDWAEGKANQHIHYIFPLPFRELNLMMEKKISLIELLGHFFPEIKELRSVNSDAHKILFIFDGLDECRLPLDFQNNESLWDVTESASVDALLTNLIKGNLFPSALLWITSRPTAANQIPPKSVDLITEIRGFSDAHKEEYFKKKIIDQTLANSIISHMKSSRSLYIMCHIPVFCWIAATVLERVLGEAETGEIPKTLTQMFTHFLIFQIKHRNQKYHEKCDHDPHETKEIILALGKLAFQQLEKGNLIFYEEDLRECGIDVSDVSAYSGVCTQIFKEEFGLHLGKVFSFVHLSVQEFLAALYAFLTFISKDGTEQLATDLSDIFNQSTMSDFLKSTVDKALQSENGHLDLFLRFLLGLSLESNQNLLQGLLTGSSFHNKEETVQYIKEKIRENPSTEKSINLFHCLNELNDHSLVEEVQTYLKGGRYISLSDLKLSPSQWSALVFVLLNSDDELEEFDLRKFYPSEEGLLRLLPVIRVSRKVVLRNCNLTEKSCAALASALSLNSSSLTELNLSNNKLLMDSGMKLLSAGLGNAHCKLKKLVLINCSITEEGYIALASALKLNPSHLRELNLSQSKPGLLGVKLLSEILEDPHCYLEKLLLRSCSLTEESCAVLASALSSNSSKLKELDVGNNALQDSGVKALSAGLKNSHCKLEYLGLYYCSITEDGYAALASALKSNPSHLRTLHLTLNDPGKCGVKMLSDLLEDPHYGLETLLV